jgi:hypothetical protein
VNIHCSADGSLPAGEVRARLRVAVPFAAAVPDDKARESVCATAAGGKRRIAIVNRRKITMTWPNEGLIGTPDLSTRATKRSMSLAVRAMVGESL